MQRVKSRVEFVAKLFCVWLAVPAASFAQSGPVYFGHTGALKLQDSVGQITPRAGSLHLDFYPRVASRFSSFGAIHYSLDYQNVDWAAGSSVELVLNKEDNFRLTIDRGAKKVYFKTRLSFQNFFTVTETMDLVAPGDAEYEDMCRAYDSAVD